MPPHTAPTATGPLTGIRVIILGQIAAGPFAGSLFADLGADVVKIERPDGGDGMRQWPPLTGASDNTSGFSENFASVTRNKRSVILDLKNANDGYRVEKYRRKTCFHPRDAAIRKATTPMRLLQPR